MYVYNSKTLYDYNGLRKTIGLDCLSLIYAVNVSEFMWQRQRSRFIACYTCVERKREIVL